MGSSRSVPQLAEKVLENVSVPPAKFDAFVQQLNLHLKECPRDYDFYLEEDEGFYCKDCADVVPPSSSQDLFDLSFYTVHCLTSSHKQYRDSTRGSDISPAKPSSAPATSSSSPTKAALSRTYSSGVFEPTSAANHATKSSVPPSSTSAPTRTQPRAQPTVIGALSDSDSEDDVVLVSKTAAPKSAASKRNKQGNVKKGSLPATSSARADSGSSSSGLGPGSTPIGPRRASEGSSAKPSSGKSAFSIMMEAAKIKRQPKAEESDLPDLSSASSSAVKREPVDGVLSRLSSFVGKASQRAGLDSASSSSAVKREPVDDMSSRLSSSAGKAPQRAVPGSASSSAAVKREPVEDLSSRLSSSVGTASQRAPSSSKAHDPPSSVKCEPTNDFLSPAGPVQQREEPTPAMRLLASRAQDPARMAESMGFRERIEAAARGQYPPTSTTGSVKPEPDNSSSSSLQPSQPKPKPLDGNEVSAILARHSREIKARRANEALARASQQVEEQRLRDARNRATLEHIRQREAERERLKAVVDGLNPVKAEPSSSMQALRDAYQGRQGLSTSMPTSSSNTAAARFDPTDPLALWRQREGSSIPAASTSAPQDSSYLFDYDAQMAATTGLHGHNRSNVFDVNAEFDAAINENSSLNNVIENFKGKAATANELADFTAAASKAIEFQGNLKLEDAAHDLGIKDLKQLRLPGLADGLLLMPHQVLGVSFMVRQEGLKKFRGGVLADEMGLGKTVQAISLLCHNKPTAEDRARKRTSTLIVAPLALLEQWQEEIDTKTQSRSFRCLIYHGPKKTKSLKELQQYDVVLTTHQSLANEWSPDDEVAKKAAKRKAKASGKPWNDEEEDKWEPDKPSGLLYEMQWFRIIIDEAHNIRNRGTKLSRASTRLTATYRWCLTGTPILNNLADAYSLVRFLRIRPYYDWTEYRDRIVRHEKRRPDFAAKRALAVLQPMMLRRKKDSKLDGKPLLQLPEKFVNQQILDFEPEERSIYDSVQAHMQVKFKRFLRQGTVLKNYSQVLVMMLRLRQICSHPALVSEDPNSTAIEESEVNKIRRERKRAVTELGQEKFRTILKRLLDETVQRCEAEKAGQDVSPLECPCCYEALMEDSDLVTPCGHPFCAKCIDEQFDPQAEITGAAAGEASDGSTLSRPCYICRQPFQQEQAFLLKALLPTDRELDKALGGTEEDLDEAKKAIDKCPQAPMLIDSDSEDDEEVKPSKRLKRKKRRAPVIASDDIAMSDDDQPAGSKGLRSDSSSDDDLKPPRKVKKTAPKQRASKGKGKAKRADDSDDADEHGDLRDFVVRDDDSNSDYDDGPPAKKQVESSSDDDMDAASTDDDDDLVGSDVDVLETSRTKRVDLASKHAKRLKDGDKTIPSTKMKAMLEHLLVIREKGEKCLVFSQFTQCLDIIAGLLRDHDFKFTRYQGDMSKRNRDDALSAFSKSNKVTVMLMSLKCGGVGLNLTKANHVINTDLVWAPATELQAWDRVHRMGQVRDCHIQRLIIRDTIEDRLLDVQSRKSVLANGALGEGTNGKGKANRKLTVRDLGKLFGLGAEVNYNSDDD